MAFGDKVQHQTNNQYNSTNRLTIAVTLPSTPTAGNLLFCFLSWQESNSTPVVTQGASDTFTQVGSIYGPNDQQKQAFFYLIVTNETDTTITADFGADTARWMQLTIVEYQGPFDATPFIAASYNYQNPNPTTTDGVVGGSIASTYNNALIIGATNMTFNLPATTLSAGTGYTGLATPAQNWYGVESKVLATAATVSVTFTQSAADHTATTTLAFRQDGDGASSVTGTASSTESNDTIAITGSSQIYSNIGSQEGNDTVVAAGNLQITSTIVVGESSDTSSSSGVITLIGQVVSTEGLDGVVITANLAVSGLIVVQEAVDSSSGVGSVSTTGQISTSEDNDTCNSAASQTISGTVSSIELSDIATSSGGSGIIGQINYIDSNDTVVSSATLTISGQCISTLENDTATIGGTSTIIGNISSTEGADTLDSIGLVGSAIAGTVNVLSEDDVGSLAGNITLFSDAAIVEENDNVIILANYRLNGALVVSELDDTSDINGISSNNGQLSIVEGNDAATSTATILIFGQINRQEPNDSVISSGSVSSLGTIDTQEGSDVCGITATIGLYGNLAIVEISDSLASMGYSGALVSHPNSSQAIALDSLVNTQFNVEIINIVNSTMSVDIG